MPKYLIIHKTDLHPDTWIAKVPKEYKIDQIKSEAALLTTKSAHRHLVVEVLSEFIPTSKEVDSEGRLVKANI